MAKRVAILGSTGSIGTNTLRVIDALGAEYSVAALTAHDNVDLLATQALKFRPPVIAVTNPQKKSQLHSLTADYDGTILTGPDSLTEIASAPDVDIVVTALVGAAGLPAVLSAVKMGKRLAIANKEPLVIAGSLLSETARTSGAQIIPIDSEHSAIFQALQAGTPDEVQRIILTASGGPFRTADMNQMHNATAAEALAHPTWNMGPKITVDSATMVNKALEIIEAVWLFDMPVDKIHVLVHPESVVHSMVEFVDGSVVAQMGTPDMCMPIQYALTYPKRREGIAARLSLEELGTLTFEKPDMQKFKALKIGFDVAETGGSAPVVFNAANEAAVAEFLAGRITLGRIVELIDESLGKHNLLPSVSLDELLAADCWARQYVHDAVECLKT